MALFNLWTVQRTVDIKNRPRIPIPDEDPYSEAINSGSSSGSSGPVGSATKEQNGKPPKLPPRDSKHPHDIPTILKVIKFYNNHF